MPYATDPQYVDLLLSNTQSEALSDYLTAENIPFQDLNPLYKQIWYPRDQLPSNLLDDVLYTALPKLYLPQTLTALENAGILAVQNRSPLELKGERVLFGCIDSGIAYTHPAFRTPDGQTRIVALWDQTENAPDTSLSPFGYGTLYKNTDIQSALQNPDPYTIVPSRDMTGHGTAVAAIAAGSENSAAAFCGAAPLALIAVVKLPKAKTWLLSQACLSPDAEVYAETDILAGIFWLLSLSREVRMPLVICLGMQTWQGPHNGDSALERTISYLTDSPGVCFVTGTGNEADRQHHRMFNTYNSTMEARTELLVAENTTAFSMELWAPPVFSFRLSLSSPSGDSLTDLVPRLGSQRLSFPLDQSIVEIQYETFRSESGNQLVYFRFFTPAPGIWTIGCSLLSPIDADVHLWLPPSDTTNGDVRFLQPDPFTTAMGPANTTAALSSAAALTVNTSTLSASGRGYNFSGGQVPTLAAPGENILTASYIEGYQMVTGSSAAAALTAGAAVLVADWGRTLTPPRDLSTRDIRTFLLKGCNRPPQAVYPNPQSGYGFLDISESFLRFLT